MRARVQYPAYWLGKAGCCELLAIHIGSTVRKELPLRKLGRRASPWKLLRNQRSPTARRGKQPRNRCGWRNDETATIQLEQPIELCRTLPGLYRGREGF